MGSDRDIVILAHDIDVLVRRMRDDIDLRIAVEKFRHDIAHRELHGRDRGLAADGTGGFTQPVTYGCLSQFGLAQHHHRVAIELPSGVGHSEPT